MTFHTRVAHLQQEGAYAVLARAQALEAQGREIIHLEIGQPDFPTFANISQAGIQAIQDGYTRYNPPAGVPRLRQVIAEDAGLRRGMEFNPDAGGRRARRQTGPVLPHPGTGGRRR